MPHISRHPVPKKVFDEISNQFIASLIKLDTKNARHFFHTFFTKTERSMFAKRLAIFFLVREGWTQYRVAKFLKVSNSTVERVVVQLSALDQSVVERIFKKLAKNSNIIGELRALLLEGFSRDPKKRNKWLREFESQYG